MMNKRIKELAEQAFQPINDISTEGVADRYTFEQAWFQMYNQKFAELIVRECLHIVRNNNPCPPGTTIMYSLLQDEYFDKGWQVAVETKSNQIKKHFGVEE